jgi:DNA invertase Pin-like site-specific DNA recombinase
MVIAYIRVSTQEQTYQGQRHEIEAFCHQRGILVDKWIEEKVSGLKNLQERTLGKTIRMMKKGDLLVCTELSRLGRNTMMVMSILQLCSEKQLRIMSIKDNFELSNSIQSKILAFAFSLAAEIERNLISQRTKEALAAKKAEGKKLGRPCGKTAQQQRFESMHDEIVLMQERKMTYKQIAAQVGVHQNTLCRYMKAYQKEVV